MTIALKRANEQLIMSVLDVIVIEMKTGVIAPEEVNMSHYKGSSSCGTTHCIGGHIGVKLGLPGHSSPLREGKGITVRDGFEFRLDNLMYMNLSNREEYRGNWKEVPISKVLIAIQNFKAGKKYPWQGVVSNDE